MLGFDNPLVHITNKVVVRLLPTASKTAVAFCTRDTGMLKTKLASGIFFPMHGVYPLRRIRNREGFHW